MRAEATSVVASSRSGRASGGSNFLEGGIARGACEQGGQTTEESTSRGNVSARDRGAGEEPGLIRLQWRGREVESHTGIIVCGVLSGPVARVLIPYNRVENPGDMERCTGRA